jgi:hypothetical protein
MLVAKAPPRRSLWFPLALCRVGHESLVYVYILRSRYALYTWEYRAKYQHSTRFQSHNSSQMHTTRWCCTAILAPV